ncbi:MAG: hypothetical protein ABH878_03815, partial [bacterium]
ITDCEATDGGAIYFQNAAVTVNSCVLIGCTAGNGAGIYLNHADGSTVENCFIVKHVSTST